MNKREITDLIFLGSIFTLLCVAALFFFCIATGAL